MTLGPMSSTSWTPPLRLQSQANRCRLTLAGVAHGSGATLQQAANDLLVRLYDVATALRDGDLRPNANTGPLAADTAAFLWEIGQIASRGGDLRARVFGHPTTS